MADRVPEQSTPGSRDQDSRQSDPARFEPPPLAGFIGPRIDLLVRNIGRNVNEVARTSFIDKLEPVSPPHSRSAPNNVKHRFKLPVMVRSGSGIGRYEYSAGPQLRSPVRAWVMAAARVIPAV
jgi:hypothetical protein